MGVGTGFAVLFAAAGVTAVVAVARLAKGLSLRLAKLGAEPQEEVAEEEGGR